MLKLLSLSRAARRYTAGKGVREALKRVKELREEGLLATVNYLGEEVRSHEKVAESVREYANLAALLPSDAEISVKPTQLGLALGKSLYKSSLLEVASAAAVRGIYVTVDSERPGTITDTLDGVLELWETGFNNLGLVLQAKLPRSHYDVMEYVRPGMRVRVCKGVYPAEDSLPKVAESFVNLSLEVLERGALLQVATHDEALIYTLSGVLQASGWSKADYEIELLLGVREDLAKKLVAQGYRVRLYVPYGARWQAYTSRRLQEAKAKK